MTSPEKIVVDNLIHDLRVRPEDFSCDSHHLSDRRNNVSYWVCNGASYARMDTPYKMDFGFIQGWRFHSALKKWKAYRNVNPVNVN